MGIESGGTSNTARAKQVEGLAGTRLDRLVRAGAASVLAANILLCVVTALGLATHFGEFPRWFLAIFLSGTVVLLGVLALFVQHLFHTNSPATFEHPVSAHAAWGLAAISVLCASSLHKFYPFHAGIIEWWPLIPSSHPIMARLLRFNYAFTAAALVLTLLLWATCVAGRRRTATVGAVVLAGLFLIPNDSCPNPFNELWLEWIGGSPMMFVPCSITLCVGVCALTGTWRLRSLVLMGVLCAATLLLGLGHVTGLVW